MGTHTITGTEAVVVELLDGGMAIVDPELEAEVGRHCWRLDTKTRSRPRAFIYYQKGAGSRKLYLERFVTEAPNGKFVLFLNRNTLDCRRGNLVIVEWRRELFVPDEIQRAEWELEEASSRVINPQRRREDAWRMWCESDRADNIEKIAAWLRSDARAIKQDLRAMAGDPLGAVQRGDGPER